MADLVTVDAVLVDVTGEPPTVDVWADQVATVEVVTEGPRGPAGPAADHDTILAYVETAVGDYFTLHPMSWTHEQVTAVYQATFLHPLDHRPVVVLTDTAGDELALQVTYPAANLVTVTSNTPVAWTATLT